ncbi:ERF family protein [Burkholderia contaminans]|uniref:ERF family protein n=1 Tax=Burkholderia TaxID=32008 RepID=UPI0010F44868|nr:MULTISPECIES: ERF family protein [Burkholderia]MBD1412895.1 ERF family protein [Burkholderia contaminans]UXZ68655.1 ERF family protein [Burkholderia contaminans]UXZ76416.1 ERF family protein [Burkholderia contaminans]
MQHVHAAIKQITKAISADGIAKTGQNDENGYAFRTIDDIKNRLAPLLDEHNLIITPNEEDRICVERRTTNGVALFFVTVRVRYELTSTVDDSVKSITVSGEGMDTGDRATSKALTDAYKSAVTQAFCIATKNNLDAESTSHTAASRMNEDERTKHERAILAAPDAAALKRAFTNATAASKRAGDEESRKTFVTAKETRTKQLAEAATKKAEQTKPTEKAAA